MLVMKKILILYFRELLQLILGVLICFNCKLMCFGNIFGIWIKQMNRWGSRKKYTVSYCSTSASTAVEPAETPVSPALVNQVRSLNSPPPVNRSLRRPPRPVTESLLTSPPPLPPRRVNSAQISNNTRSAYNNRNSSSQSIHLQFPPVSILPVLERNAARHSHLIGPNQLLFLNCNDQLPEWLIEEDKPPSYEEAMKMPAPRYATEHNNQIRHSSSLNALTVLEEDELASPSTERTVQPALFRKETSV